MKPMNAKEVAGKLTLQRRKEWGIPKMEVEEALRLMYVPEHKDAREGYYDNDAARTWVQIGAVNKLEDLKR